MSRAQDPLRFLPLSPPSLHILLALAAGELHGYAIMQAIVQQSDGQYKVGPGTLYDNLQRMMNDGLVEEARRARPGEDPRRRYYRLSGLGRAVLGSEVERLDKVVQQAKVQMKAAAWGGGRT